MSKNSKNDKKQVCIKLSMEVYTQLEEKSARRNLDKTNYITYLIQQDKDDMFSKNASKALNDITYYVEILLNSVSKDDKIRPFVVGVKDGVCELWQYLR